VFLGTRNSGGYRNRRSENSGVTELVPYAHRDLEPGCARSLHSNQCLLMDPGNIMIADNGALIRLASFCWEH
jgi:hypothetical protein